MPLDQQLILDLEKLRKYLNSLHKELNNSGTERTAHFLTYVGQDCSYFKKSMEFFLAEDYDKLKNVIRDLADIFDIIDGRRNG
jgi:hypothetical protein